MPIYSLHRLAEVMTKPSRSFSVSNCLMTVAMLCFILPAVARADERTLTPEQMEKLAEEGELAGEAELQRPDKLPDLTKGELIGEKRKQDSWHLGPTGIIGYMVGGFQGDQIQVESVLEGSPAAGKLHWGDVILGVEGKKFRSGEHLGVLFGNAIIRAELPENEGQLKLLVWRDLNFAARNAKRDVVNVDVEKLFNEAAADDTLYDWKPESARTAEVLSADYEKFPLDGKFVEITLTLDVLPAYSETSPYDCPKADKIRENAWKILEAQFESGRLEGGRGGTVAAIALVASGKPEHREMVREWVRSKRSPWLPPKQRIGEMFEPNYRGYKGYQSWHHGFNGLDCAIYYDATGDEFVLPALRKYAIETAMGQAGGGSWGHTFAYPSFNGGELHKMNPGYGALNAAGNRCFFLVALAQKLGIEHPEIDLAVKRAHKFFGSYVDKGAIPYGFHPAAATDDSNGKNTGVAFALKLIGDDHGAKYFAQMSTHASFTRRGGHGNDYFWHWSPWAATLCGPEGTIVTMRNLRWHHTLCRRFDGGFVIHSPTGSKALRNATATYLLHYSAPLKQTIITGKDVDPSYAWTEKEMAQLMASALPQLNDADLIQRAGSPWAERPTDELFQLLDIFKPKARGQYAAELGKRYLAGETEILPRIVKLLDSDEPRLRDAACRCLLACGKDAAIQYLSKVARLLDDPKEHVRMQALRTLSQVSDSKETELALLKATLQTHPDTALSPNNFPAWAQKPLLGNSDSKFSTAPFDAGYDPELVEAALEKLIVLDPANSSLLKSKSGVWSKETVIRLAGPITFAAEEEQINDQMFAGRSKAGQAVLGHFNYLEALQASSRNLRKKAEIARDVRPYVTFKRPLVDVDTVKANPGLSRDILQPLKLWLADDPLATIVEKKGEQTVSTRVQDLIAIIEAARTKESLPSLQDDVAKNFLTQLEKLDSNSAKIAICRAELKDPTQKNYFRKIAAMDFLVEQLGEEACTDLAPYLAHDYWRLNEHAFNLAVNLPEPKASARLLQIANEANPVTVARILAVLVERGDVSALEFAEKSLSHEDETIRADAVRAIGKLGSGKNASQIFSCLETATGKTELHACEDALLSLSQDEKIAEQVRKESLELLSKYKSPQRASLIWVLAQLGGESSMSALELLSEGSDNAEFHSVVYALSWSPDPEASKLLLRIIEENLDTPRALLAADEATRRMVIGPDGIGSLSEDERLDFAEPLLRMIRNKSMVAYLGTVHTGRSTQVLQRVMRQGGVTKTAATSIIEATGNMETAPAKERELAAAALIDAIEYIEVNYLRGGVAVRLQDPDAAKSYAYWKTLSAQAGKHLLKLDKPEEVPIPEFNELDLDL
jgi:HEAT repeat protein